MIFYHASKVQELKVLEPRISNHHVPLIYFSSKRENTLVYLSNAVEKFCQEKGFIHKGPWEKWATYGFDKQGIMVIQEYYPDYLEETYGGVSGYIYSISSSKESSFNTGIPFAFTLSTSVKTDNCEYIKDALKEITDAQMQGLIKIQKYDDFISNESSQIWLKKTIKQEYKKASEQKQDDYVFFLEKKFSALLL